MSGSQLLCRGDSGLFYCALLLAAASSICHCVSTERTTAAYAQISSGGGKGSGGGRSLLLPPTPIVTNSRQIYPGEDVTCDEDADCTIDCPASHSFECINTMCRCTFHEFVFE